MEDKDFIYEDQERGTIIYIGLNQNDGQNHKFNPSHFNELKNSGKYQEAKDYLNDYQYANPTYYNKVQRMKDQCDTWILYNQHQYELAGPENKSTIDFINLYDNDYDNLDVSDNELAKQYTSYLNDIFGDSDKITLDFAKTKQRFIFDSWIKDNKDNDIHAYKKRIGESLGMNGGVSDNYLRQNGVVVTYGDYDGAGTMTIDKSSPILKNIITSFINDRYSPVVSRITKTGGKISYDNNTSVLNISGASPIPLNNYMIKMNDMVRDAKRTRTNVGFRDDYVATSVNYPFQFYGSDALDVRIDTGGQTGSAAAKTRAEYERELIGAMRTMLPGMQDIRLFTGPKNLMNNDEYELAQPLSDKEQAELLQLVTSADDTDIIPSLNITSDGRCGFTFTVNGKLGSKNVKERERIQFTVYNWNTDKINQLMDANPEYRAIRKINEISRYNGTYESLDGNYYTYIGGGYGAEAIYEDGDGKRYNMFQMKDIRMRDDLVNQQVNNILVRTRNQKGKYVREDNSFTYSQAYEDDIIASAIYIGSQVIQQNPIDNDGKPLSINQIVNYLHGNAYDKTYTEDIAKLNAYSYPIIMYLRDIKQMIYNQMIEYNAQRPRFN